MDVLIIGGTGLISAEITRILSERGHDVTVYNRGETDADLPAGVETVYGDRTDHDRFEAQMSDVDVGCVVDMWCMTPADAESAVRAFDGRVDQYVFCSTVDVYRSPPDRYPITEDCPRIRSGDGYAPDKAECERIFERAHEDGAFAATVVRPGYTYGVGGGFLTNIGSGTGLIARLRRGDPVVVHGDGTALWGACHRDDVAPAFVEAVGNETAYGEDYHVPSEEWLTWNQYFRRAAEAMDAPEPEFAHVPTDLLLEHLPEDRTAVLERVVQYSYYYDTAKARRDLDFEYTVSWTEGVERVVDWLDEHGEIDEDDPLQDEIIDAWRDAERTFSDAFAE